MTLPSHTRAHLADWYRRNRARSAALFDLIDEEAYYARPIALRLPVVFYEGHLPVFSFNTLVKRGLGRPSIHPRFEQLFARGVDPHESVLEAGALGTGGAGSTWPARAEVLSLAAEADRQVIDALESADIDRAGDPLLDRAEAAFCILEHEAMHQETLIYMWHQLPHDQKRKPPGYRPITEAIPPTHEWVDVPGGSAVLGADPRLEAFSWDNERPRHDVLVKSFRIERHNVTNERYLDFVNASGYHDERFWLKDDWEWLRSNHIEHPPFWACVQGAWRWRGMFEWVDLPRSWPVYVSHAEASAYARWRGTRLPSEAEYHRAAFGTPKGEPRRHPWGAEAPDGKRGVFDFSSWDPEPAGSHPSGRSAYGVEDLVGNGWEWTSTPFGSFEGFSPLPSYPEYSKDFFDGEHFVMKGASPATARELIRPSFRNWFRSRYPYVYATFRCVDDRSGEGRR